MKRTARKLVAAVAAAALILLAHAVLIRCLADKRVAASLLSAGPHVPAVDLALAGLFMFVRLMAVVGLPGLVLAHLGMAFVDATLRRGRRTETERLSGR